MKIELEIKSCQECPFFKDERMYTADSFENAFNWFCNKNKELRKIAGYVELNDNPEIPEWCPCKIKNKK